MKENQENWEVERKEREKESRRAIEEWEKAKRFQKIELLKKKWEKKEEPENLSWEIPSPGTENLDKWRVWRMKCQVDSLMQKTSIPQKVYPPPEEPPASPKKVPPPSPPAPKTVPLKQSILKASTPDKIERPNQTTKVTETGVDVPTVHLVHAGGLGEVYRVGMKNLTPPPSDPPLSPKAKA